VTQKQPQMLLQVIDVDFVQVLGSEYKHKGFGFIANT